MNRARLAIFAAALSLLTLAASAQAQPRSWTVGKGIAQGPGMAVIGVNLASIQKSALYQQVMPLLLSQQPEAKQHIDEAKANCGIDLTTVISDVTVIMSSESEGLILVGLKGTNQDRLLACASKMAAKHGHPGKITAKKTGGGIVEYSLPGEADKFYAAWIKTDVVAIATNGHDRAALAKMIAGKGLAGDLSAAVGKVNTGASVWFAMAKAQPLPTGGVMKSAYGSVDLTAAIMIDGHVVVGSAADAKKLADMANGQIAQMSGQLPPKMAAIVKNIKIAAAGDEFRVAATLSQADIQAIIGMVGQMFMGGGGAHGGGAPPSP
jgi:hypothetical protein